MLVNLRPKCIRIALLIGLAGLVPGTGCGAVNVSDATLRAFVDAGCESAAYDAVEDASLVILDWTGGVNPIYPDRVLAGVDLAAFPTEDGGNLAMSEASFKEDVRRRITEIYCDREDLPVRVINAEDDFADRQVSVVHITQELPPKGGADVGEGEYDPCNQDAGNAAILFGERLLSLSAAYSYDEWVNVFANICAHEIGHTLGFAHVAREDFEPSARSLYVELMLAGHTMAELRRRHRFVVDLPNCPADGGATAHRVEAAGVDH